MVRYCLVSFIVCSSIFLISSTTAACGPNEVAKEKPDCVSDCCPAPKGEPTACLDPCASACKCAFQYRRAQNGTCIPVRKCPPIPCGENQVFDFCPNVCVDLCSYASPDGEQCKHLGKTGIQIFCIPNCRCKKYYWRNEHNECVPYNQCPQFLETSE